jgi:hypothetical protein
MMRNTFLALTAAAMLAATVPAHAVPEVLQYQGRLTDAAGEPLNDPVRVTFSLYVEDDGGTALWTQTHDDLPLDNGRFSVLLGGDDAPFTPALEAALEEGAELFLGIKIGDDPEMTPRQRIASVVYALRAAESEHAKTAETVEGSPGIAHAAAHRTLVPAEEALSVVSVTITTPADGLVLVAGGGTLILDNRGGDGVLCHANIGEVEDAVPDTAMGLVIANIDSTDVRVRHYVPFHSQRVFEKPAGTHTFYLNVKNHSVRAATANRPSITASFFPINYGESDEALARRRGPTSTRAR